MIEKLVYIPLFSFLVFSIPLFRKIYFLESIKKEYSYFRKKRYDYFDFLKGLAILAVILIHINGFFYDDIYRDNIFVVAFNNFLRFAIPFFLISSGLLLSTKNGLYSFYSKKMIRIFLPYSFLTIIITAYYKASYFDIFKAFLLGTASPPYYFIALLLQLYLIYPFLLRLSKFKYFLHIVFLINIFYFIFALKYLFFNTLLFPRFIFLFSYGVFAKDRFLSCDKNFSLKEKFFYFGVIFSYLAYSFYFKSYFYNPRLFYGIALFNLLFIFKDYFKKKFFYNLFVCLGKNSLWIFLLHYFVIQAIYTIIKDMNIAFTAQYVLFVFSGLILSVAFSFLIKNIYIFFFNLVIPSKQN